MEKNSDELPLLIAEEGPLNGQRWRLEAICVLGRDAKCDIVIPDRQVSRFHARFTTTPDGILLEDLGSKNGTHRNGQPVVEPQYLEDGDVIQVALAQKFVFLSSDATLPLEPFRPGEQPLRYEMQRLRLDKRSHRVWVADQEVIPPLSAAQFHLLELLYDRQGKVVPRDELIAYVWKEDQAVGVSEQALDALIRRLRDRLAAFDSQHAYVITVRGHGVRLDNPPYR